MVFYHRAWKLSNVGQHFTILNSLMTIAWQAEIISQFAYAISLNGEFISLISMLLAVLNL